MMLKNTIIGNINGIYISGTIGHIGENNETLNTTYGIY